MRLKVSALLLLLALTGLPRPAFGFLDGLISGAKSVKDEAHKRIIENQLFQLLLAAKKNYDASVKIYKEVKRLNEGKGLVKNIASSLEAEGKKMAREEGEAFASDIAYRNDSGLDRKLDEIDIGMRDGIRQKGFGLIDRYGESIDRRSEAYAEAIRKQAKRLALRKGRASAAREEGVKVASSAPDLSSKAQGIEVQAFSDSVEALNELVAMQLSRDAKDKAVEIKGDKEIASALGFLDDPKGAEAALRESFYLVRLSRAPALLYPTRQAVSKLAAMLLGLMLAAGLIYEFARAEGFFPEVLGLPLVLVIFGLVFYDKAFASFAVLMDAVEQTVSSGDVVAGMVSKASFAWRNTGFAISASSIALRLLSVALAYLAWLVLIVFLWVRFAFFCLIYAVGPLLILCALFEPLRAMTKGWMMAAVQVGLWGLFMRILLLVMLNSGIVDLAGPPGAALKPLFASFVINIVFLAFAVICPYFTHYLMSGNIAERAVGAVSAMKGGVIQAGTGAYKAHKAYAEWRSPPPPPRPPEPTQGKGVKT